MRTREQFRTVLADLASKAKDALPANAGRIDAAVALVLAGDVVLQPDGTALVGSGSDPLHASTVNGACPCPDAPRAPDGWCKHRLSRALSLRAERIMHAVLDADTAIPPGALPTADAEADSGATPTVEPSSEPDTPTGILEASERRVVSMLPEAPASANCHVTLAGRQVQITLRDTDETRLLERLAKLLQRFPVDTPALVQTSTTPPPVCQWHGTMKESTKAKGSWYCPSRMADGSYCKERWPAKEGGPR